MSNNLRADIDITDDMLHDVNYLTSKIISLNLQKKKVAHILYRSAGIKCLLEAKFFNSLKFDIR